MGGHGHAKGQSRSRQHQGQVNGQSTNKAGQAGTQSRHPGYAKNQGQGFGPGYRRGGWQSMVCDHDGNGWHWGQCAGCHASWRCSFPISGQPSPSQHHAQGRTQGNGKGGTFKPVKGGSGKGQGGKPSQVSAASASTKPARSRNSYAALATEDADQDMEGADPDPDVALKAERKALVQSIEGKLAKVRRAKKSLEEEEDLDSVQVLIDNHVQVEQDLEAKLRQARAQYQELRPAEIKLTQAQRDLDITKDKLDNTKDEIQQVEELIAKQQARLLRLQEQQELQVAKISRLEAAIKEHHASIGGGKQGRAAAEAPPPTLPNPTTQDLSQCPAFVQLQQDYERMQQELKDALATLALAKPPAAKREREEQQVEEAAPAHKKKNIRLAMCTTNA
jgi:hypothetical protein